MTENLRPCPKCGKAGVIHHGYIDDWRYTGQPRGNASKLIDAWGVYCEKCRTHVWGYPSRRSACEAWNAGRTTGGYLFQNNKSYNAR